MEQHWFERFPIWSGEIDWRKSSARIAHAKTVELSTVNLTTEEISTVTSALSLRVYSDKSCSLALPLAHWSRPAKSQIAVLAMAPPLWLLPRSRVLGPSRASPRATPRMRAATVICHTTGEWDHSANGYVHEYRLQFDGCKNPFKGRYFRQSELRPLDERKVRVDAMGYVRHARAPDAPSPPSDGDDDALRAPDAPSPPSDGDDDASSEGPRKRGKKEASIDDDDGGDGGGGGGDDGDDDAMEEHQGAAVDDAVEGYLPGGDVHEAAD